MHSFSPVATETPGAIGKKSSAFLKELSQKVWQRTGEVKTRAYLLQRLSVAVQRGNAESVVGSAGLHPFYVITFHSLWFFLCVLLLYLVQLSHNCIPGNYVFFNFAPFLFPCHT